ncbi:MAG: flagellin N-terminal helical domain-containing protein [Alphaproteobacteria bacterium]
MSVTGVGSQSALIPAIQNLQKQLDVLHTQLGTGKKAQTLGGLGETRSLSISLRAEVSRIEGYLKSIGTAKLRLEVAQGALTRTQDITNEAYSALISSSSDIDANGQTQGQLGAQAGFEELVSLLNSRVSGHYLFAGREAQAAPVEKSDSILNGDGARAGLKQVVDERRQADLGTGDLGRLSVPAALAGVVSVEEDTAGHPFGFKITAVAGSLTGTTIAGPAGATNKIDFTFSSTLPVDGEEITVSTTLPDGTTGTIKLKATTTSPADVGEFLIGADRDTTATNFETALKAEIVLQSKTELRAASARQATSDYFDFDAANPPKRVSGPGFATATSLVNGTTTNTVYWYKGDLGTGSARDTVVVKIDSNQTLTYGARANETPLKESLKAIALLVVESYDVNVTTDKARFEALASRLTGDLGKAPGKAKIADIGIELGFKQGLLGNTEDRHRQALSVALGGVSDAENVDANEVGAQILKLQASLQASFETTSLLSRLSLVNFLN